VAAALVEGARLTGPFFAAVGAELMPSSSFAAAPPPPLLLLLSAVQKKGA
jgi:hypothetical protein